jgi:hypothetical protein
MTVDNHHVDGSTIQGQEGTPRYSLHYERRIPKLPRAYPKVRTLYSMEKEIRLDDVGFNQSTQQPTSSDLKHATGCKHPRLSELRLNLPAISFT